jgi:5-formyltetrahydrofolate cyclo-ligase
MTLPPLDKTRLRRQILHLRQAVAAPELAAEQLAQNLWPVVAKVCAEFGPSCVVGAYWPMRGEIDPLPLLRLCQGAGMGTALPVVVARDQPLVFRAWALNEPLETGAYGTRQPPSSAPEIIPSLVLVPLVAFDRTGARLGYGGGFYDRTLSRLRAEQPTVAIGLAHAIQETVAVPREPHDQPLNWLATDVDILGPFEP